MTIFFRQPGPKSRTAGVVAPVASVTVPALPRQSSFASSTWGDAFWLVRPPTSRAQGPGTLYVSSGARVLRDLRGELGLATDPNSWTPEVFSTLRERLAALGVPASFLGRTAPARGQVVQHGWIEWALWFTYERETWPRDSGVVLLPHLIIRPIAEAVYPIGSTGQRTAAVSTFDPAELSIDPWAVEELNVNGTVEQDGASDGWLAGALFLALLTLAGGDSK